jgi:predicted adenine nucleotide alpha hydrolase (AANH) superfamily ATPase
MKLLLHTCCGPCFLGVWEDLKTKDIQVTNYFYNPNIFPEVEQKLRLENLRIVTGNVGSELIVNNVDFEVVKTGGVCLKCYRLRLEETAAYATEYGFDTYSTTLLVSPYQQHEALRAIGEEVGAQYGVSFYYVDWRPYFREGQSEAKKSQLYRQKYCGCQYSLETN